MSARKSNGHPVIKALRAISTEQKWDGCVIVAVSGSNFASYSYGSNVKRCNALAQVLDADNTMRLAMSISDAITMADVS
jgi:hypothetical protein